MSATWCARDGFGVSATSCGGDTTATPTRHFNGSGKFSKCWLYGRTFKTSDEAFAAMHAQGYGDLYFSRSSVPLPTFAGLASERRKCEFDGLYRLFKWKVKNGQCGSCVGILRGALKRRAAKVGIFHPVARVFNNPRGLERSLL